MNALLTLALTAFLMIFANALPQNTVLLPFGNMQPGETVSVGGVGSDGRTTFVAFETAAAVPDSPVPTITFLEGPSDIIVPTQSFEISAGQGQIETFVIYQSCGVGAGGLANCMVSEEVRFMGTTASSAIFETVTVSAVTLSGAAPTQTPSPSTTPTPTITPSASQGVPMNSSPSSLSTSDFFDSTDSTIPTDSGAASVPTLTGGATPFLAPPAGLVALISALLTLL